MKWRRQRRERCATCGAACELPPRVIRDRAYCDYCGPVVWDILNLVGGILAVADAADIVEQAT